MAQINTLGPVGFNLTGEYDNTHEYEKLDVVYYEGSSYVAKGASIGQLPTDTEYWDCIAVGYSNQSGATTDRPTVNLVTGKMFFDTTLGKPIWYNSTNWVDSTGVQV